MRQNALPSHIVDARLTLPMKDAMAARDHLMKFDITSFQAVAANLAVEGEVCDLAHALCADLVGSGRRKCCGLAKW